MSRSRIQRFQRRPRLAAGLLLLIAFLLAVAWWRSRPALDALPPPASSGAPPASANVVSSPTLAAPPPVFAPGKAPLRDDHPRVPAFIAGLDDRSRFVLRDGRVNVHVDEGGLALALMEPRPPPGQPARTWGLRWSMAGARRVDPEPGGQPLAGVVNDLRGRDPGRHHAGLLTYDRLVYRDVFDGVDVELEGKTHGLEYTLRVEPGAPVPELRFLLDGAESVSVEEGGESLAIDTGAGRITEGALLAYQEGPDGERREVPVRYAYARKGSGALAWEYGLQVGPHDPALPLVIDPTLGWSSYIGGSTGDQLYGMTVDVAGNRYVTGYTLSADYPIVGGFQSGINGPNDAFITKIGTSDTIVWSTFYGGNGADFGLDVAVDSSSNVYVVGHTYSSDLFIVNGFQTVLGNTGTKTDGFVLKIAPGGASIVWSSYLGGDGFDSAEALAVDSSQNVYVTGSTESTNLPLGAGGYDNVYGGGGGTPPDAFVSKINAGSSATLAWSTYLGGSSSDTGYDVSVDATGVYVVGYASAGFPFTAGAYDTTINGQDAFLAKLNLGGTGLLYSTFLGGSGTDTGVGLAVDSSGNAYVGGNTTSADFPFLGGFDNTLGGTQDQFVAEINSTGSALVWSSYLGGSGADTTHCVELDAAGQVFVGGETTSTDYPLIGAFDSTYSGASEGVVARVNAGGGFLGWSSYLGGSGNDSVYSLSWDSSGVLYASGQTASADFPIVGGFDPTADGGIDGYIARILSSGVVPPSAGGPVKLVFTTSAQTVPAGSCSGPVTVQSQDASSVPTNVSALTVVNLTASPSSGFAFYSDPGCSTTTTSVNIAAGGNTTPSFYFKGTVAGSVTVTAAASGLSSANQVETITVLAVSQLVFTTSAQTVNAGVCSTVATVQRQDSLGNPVTTGSTTVSLTAVPSAGFGFYSDPACTTSASSFNIIPGSSNSGFYFKGTVAGSYTVTAAAAGLTSVNQTETITALAASALSFTTSAQTVNAGSCSAVATVQRQDSFGNPVTSGSNTVNLTVNPTTGFTFYSDPACGTVSTSFTIGAGSSTGNFYFKGTASGSFTVTAASA
ncbi:MAG TPA: SBBP repeat-containing protein, partial [Myxococcales bacterium]|nr:SBBP repeat-containing protein [Myxococcales bacterium]